MINDRITNLAKYINSNDYRIIKDSFLDFVRCDMPDGKYEIDKDRIYANVMSLYTKESSDCKLESHDKYIDIQCSIYGTERIDIFQRSKLIVLETYDSDRDVTFYEKDEDALLAHIYNPEGFFTLLMPDEAHSPQQCVGDIQCIKKFVIKYSIDSWRNDNGNKVRGTED